MCVLILVNYADPHVNVARVVGASVSAFLPFCDQATVRGVTKLESVARIMTFPAELSLLGNSVSFIN